MISLVLFFSSCATTQETENIKKAEAHNKIGSYYLKNNKLNEAYIEFQKAVKLDPENKETLNYLGYISTRYRKYDQAETYYKRAISIDPDYSDALNNLGFLYLDTEKWDNAIKCFRSALDNPVYQTPEKAYSGLGHAYYEKGNYPKAEEVLNEALIRNPVFPPAMYTLGLVYAKLEQYESAIEAFKKAVGILPNYTDAHWELAHIYLRLGKKNKALKHFRAVSEGTASNNKRREALEQIERLKY